MARRIEVELTSARDDNTFTWRAAGAREPRGVVDASLLYQGAKVGDVVRAEVEMDVDGINILSVTPPKGKSGPPEGLLQIVGPSQEFQAVTTSLVPKSDRPRGGRDRRDRRDRPADGERPERRPGRPDARGRPDGGRGERAGGERRGQSDRPQPERAGRARDDRGTAGRSGRERDRAEQGRPRPHRLNPASTHRNAVLESLSPEQRPIAEQILRGGIPAVRKAIDEQNAKARAEGLPEVRAESLLGLAEELLPRLKGAEWRDRAEAAVADVDAIGLRDLRSVVSGGEANARDEETRALAATLREALEARLKRDRDEWVAGIESALAENRLVRALRLSTRPPDPTIRVPADLAMKLSAAASEGLSPDSTPDRWAALLEAVVASPVRTTVKPAGLPADPGEALMQAARQAAGRIPHLAQLLGLALPPPPAPVKKGAARPRPVPPPPRQPQRPEPAAATPEATAEAAEARDPAPSPPPEHAAGDGSEQVQ